jgi:hypothetical protein
MTDDISPAETSPPRKRKKSQKRQRNKQLHVPCLDEEFNKAATAAGSSGLSLAAWCRSKIFDGDPGPRSQRRISLDTTKVSSLIGQLGYYGNNINQTAYELHAFGERALGQDFDTRKREIDEIIDCLLELIGRPPRTKTA